MQGYSINQLPSITEELYATDVRQNLNQFLS